MYRDLNIEEIVTYNFLLEKYVCNYNDIIILGVIKRNPLFFHLISCKNNGFLFTTPNIYILFIFIFHVLKYFVIFDSYVPCIFSILFFKYNYNYNNYIFIIKVNMLYNKSIIHTHICIYIYIYTYIYIYIYIYIYTCLERAMKTS